MDKLLDVKKTAELLGLGVRTVYRLVSLGELPHVRVGGSIRFNPKALERWCDSQNDVDQWLEKKRVA